MKSRLEAARTIYRHGDSPEAVAMLQHMFANPETATQSFDAYLALLEIWIAEDKESAQLYLEELVSGQGPNAKFWDVCSLAEQAVLFEWLGQIQYQTQNYESAYESLSRAASLGRDTSLLWRLLGDTSLRKQELDLGVRYMKRSLTLYRQLDLELMSGKTHVMGSFSGQDPLNWSHGSEDYLRVLLMVVKIAKGKRSLKQARELLMEMLHQFPNEPRIPKLRLMLERSIVEHSVTSHQAIAQFSSQNSSRFF